jgi:hypothetical protein
MSKKTRKGPGRKPLAKADRPEAFTVRIHPQYAKQFRDICDEHNASQRRTFEALISYWGGLDR